MHTPVDVTERALQEVVEARADCLITVGGGSTTGLGKALALRTGLPQIVVPTTYAGSEVTRSEEHTSELQSLMRISYAVFCLNNTTCSINILNEDPDVATTYLYNITTSSDISNTLHPSQIPA